MKTDIITKGLCGLAILLMSAGAVSCDVHEWPEPAGEEQFRIELVFDTEFTDQYYSYTRAEEQTRTMQYTVRAYPVVNGTTDRKTYKESVLTREVAAEADYDCTAYIDLTPGEYHLMVWSEFLVDGEGYYDLTDFAKITVDTDPYTGDTENRRTFRGSTNIIVPSDKNLTNSELVTTITMSSPMSRYIFVATDLEQFIEAQKKATGRAVSLDDYYVTVVYPMFMPNAYNFFSGKPADSLTGIRFNSKLANYSTGKASLGFDYVFVNGSESSLRVQMTVYRKSDGKQVARTPQIDVPTRRGLNVIVEGPFLSIQRSDGVGIDPGYSGDINIYF